jgi:diguanylate cyclase (GGDEF)-like protein/PAS domain S-box-containing protein
MGVSKKTLIIVASIFVCILTALFFYLRFSVLNNYIALEKIELTNRIVQAVKILNKNIDSADRVAANLSISNDAYDFINGNNDAYASRNISPVLLEELQIDLFALIDNNSNIMFSVLKDKNGNYSDNLSEETKTLLSNNEYLTGKNNIRTGLSGIMRLEGNPYIFISKPVLQNDSGAAPPAGTMILCQILDDNIVTSIGNELRNPVFFLNINEIGTQNDFKDILKKLLGGSSYEINYKSSKEIEGYTVIRDIDSNPLLLLKVTSPRDTFRQGINNIYTFFIVVMIIGIVSCLSLFFIIKKFVLSRIASLSLNAEEIGRGKDLSKNIPFKGRDEVAKLAVSINKMLRELKINENDILRSEKRFKDLVQLLPEIVIETDKSNRMVFVNQSFFEVIGYNEADLQKGLYLNEILTPADFLKAKNQFSELARGGKAESSEFAAIKEDGTIFPVLVSSVAIFDDGGGFSGVRSIAVYITSRKKEEEKLRELEERWEFALEGSGDGVWDWNFETYEVYYSKTLKEILGFDDAEFNNKFSEFKERINPDDVQNVMDNINRHLRAETPFYTAEYRIRKKDRTYMWALDRGKVIRWDAEGKPLRMIGTFTDISMRKRLEEEIKKMAFRDPLTNLPNRLLFNDRFEQTISTSLRHKKMFAVIIIDIDKFKKINDTHGHDIGDKLITHVGLKISEMLRKSDTIARFGGDEFLLLLPEIGNKTDVEIIAKKIIDSFRAKILLGDRKLSITLSMGISLYPQDGQDISILLKNADLALYDVKESGRNNYKFYVPKKAEKII